MSIVVALAGIPFGPGAMADIVILHGLLCADPLAVEPAIDDINSQELERLGCVIRKPWSLGFRIIRCEPEAMDISRKSFSQTVRRDATLPYSVCEVEAILADGQVVAAYTDYVLVFPWSRMRHTIPRFQGPEAQ